MSILFVTAEVVDNWKFPSNPSQSPQRVSMFVTEKGNYVLRPSKGMSQSPQRVSMFVTI